MTLNYEVVPAEPAHVLPIAARMREADRREVWASDRHKPYDALVYSLKASERAWTAIVDGRPVLMFGVSRVGCILNNTGSPWLLSSTELVKCWVEFLKQSRAWVEKMETGFWFLENYVHAGNLISIKWLNWCGFSVAETPKMINDEAFYRFWKEVDPCAAP